MAERKPRRTKPKTDLPLPERHVNMSNALARASHDLTLAEKRIIACGLANTDSKSARLYNEAVRNSGWVVRLTALEFADFAQIEPQTAYEQLKDAADTLIKKQWVVIDERKKITKYNWLSKATYYAGEGWVELEFTHHTAPHLLALRGSFTSYRLAQAAALRSIYSWRLMETIASWQKTHSSWRVSIEDFCHAMDAPESCRSDFFNLRKRVIDPAIQELKQKDNMIIDLELEKAGRKVTGLVFKFTQNPQGALAL